MAIQMARAMACPELQCDVVFDGPTWRWRCPSCGGEAVKLYPRYTEKTRLSMEAQKNEDIAFYRRLAGWYRDRGDTRNAGICTTVADELAALDTYLDELRAKRKKAKIDAEKAQVGMFPPETA